MGIVSYSYGTRPESNGTGHIAFWAGSSTYGWFEISPSEAYQPIYATITKGGNIILFLQSFYRRPGAKDAPVEEILSRVCDALPPLSGCS